MSEPIKVDIWSDVRCPWCYIGKRRFEEAAASFDGPIEIEFHSYELSPDFPLDFDGTASEYLQGKGMSPEQAEASLERVAEAAASIGLSFDVMNMHQTNTVKAHQLLHLAKSEGKQIEMNERLMSAYFVEAGHVGRTDELVDLATGIGLDGARVIQALESEEFLDAVRADEARAREFDIHGVPFFVFNGRYAVSGAQEPATFARVLQKVRDEMAGTGMTPQ